MSRRVWRGSGPTDSVCWWLCLVKMLVEICYRRGQTLTVTRCLGKLEAVVDRCVSVWLIFLQKEERIR